MSTPTGLPIPSPTVVPASAPANAPSGLPATLRRPLRVAHLRARRRVHQHSLRLPNRPSCRFRSYGGAREHAAFAQETEEAVVEEARHHLDLSDMSCLSTLRRRRLPPGLSLLFYLRYISDFAYQTVLTRDLPAWLVGWLLSKLRHEVSLSVRLSACVQCVGEQSIK